MKVLVRFLQLDNRGSNIRFIEEESVNKNPRTSSSISTFMLLIASCRARERPSLGAHSPAIILVVAPKFLANLEIQSPVVQSSNRSFGGYTMKQISYWIEFTWRELTLNFLIPNGLDSQLTFHGLIVIVIAHIFFYFLTKNRREELRKIFLISDPNKMAQN